tara:strand:- start:4189 stop:4692 length:504 start_codon:yes stop_codon:yes gene_type:complete
MKKIFIPTILLLLSCSSGEELPEPIEKITDSGIIFSIQEIKEMGFKKNHEYKVDDLPGAVSAYFGFIKNDLGDPEDYEIRFYNNHSDAIELGIKYTDNVTGENGCISKDCALWEEGLKHRIRMSDLGTLHPKYMSYIVYNNFILMCPGYDEGEALSKCTSIINKLTK